ncbi:hypothetical protein [Siminovitchia sp. 179-K 8D1 HS]|uniref:hypothetical protein n=1 Tax=Siminovitchia sp. 179-K 8D1 HS TaxID=3142385 RepID=UPI0039A02E6C
MVKKQRMVLFSAFLFSFITAIFPIATILLFKNSMFELSFVTKGIVHLLFIWILSNLIAAVIGTTIGMVIKNDFSVFVSGAIYSIFLWESIKISNAPLHKFLNIFDDYTNVGSNEISGVIFNSTYYLDKIFLVLFIVCILFLFQTIFGHTRRKLSLLFSIVTLLLLVFTALTGEKTVQTFHGPYHPIKANFFDVQSYHMELDLQNKLYNKALLKLVFSEDENEIQLLLDHNFIIKKIEVENKSVAYSHKNNMLTVQSSHRNGEEIDLLVEYEGKVFVENDLGVVTFYVSKNAINLPGHVFYWYPGLSDTRLADFDVQIKTPVTVYSNLPKAEHEQNVWRGKSTSLNVFAGQYQTISDNGIDYVFPISYHFEEFKSNIEGSIKQLMKDKNLSESEYITLKDRKYKQVIVGVWPLYMGDAQIIGDTLLINYIE